MTKSALRYHGGRLLLGLFYIFVTLQWLWVAAVGLPAVVSGDTLDSLLTFQQPSQPLPDSTPASFSPVLTVVAGVISLLFLVITLYILVRLPKAIAKTGDVIVHRTTDVLVPVITHHKPLPVKKKRSISAKVTVYIQLLLVVLPLVVSFFIPSIETVTNQIITTLSVWLAAASGCTLLLHWLLFTPTSQTQSRAFRE